MDHVRRCYKTKEKRNKRKEKENKRKSRKERKRMRNYADALRPRQSPIAKPNTKITTKTPNTTSRGMRILRRAIRPLPPALHRGHAERYPQAIIPEEPTSQDIEAQQMGEGNVATKKAKG